MGKKGISAGFMILVAIVIVIATLVIIINFIPRVLQTMQLGVETPSELLPEEDYDLVIREGDIYCSPPDLVITVRNLGQKDIPSFEIAYSINTAPPVIIEEAITAATVKNITIAVTVPLNYQVAIQLDPNNEIREAREDNNAASTIC